MILRTTLLMMALMITATTFAQQFIPAFDTFSGKKVAYVTLEDGTQVEGTIKDLDRKKGQIESIKLRTGDGKKVEYTAEEIKHMYLPPSGFDKFVKTMDFINDATQWGDDIDGEVISKGYAYFEKTNVQIKKKNRVLLMQLINPSFTGKIRVYTDPFARETAGLGVGGIQVTGGDEKSYYIKKGDNAAYRLEKKAYKESFKMVFEGCPAVVKKGGKKPDWKLFAEFVAEYNQCTK
jgi:hypothetical protein